MKGHPKLRDGLVIRKVAEGDDVAYTVCDAARNQYFRIDPYTRLVAAHLDGRRSLAEVSRLCQDEMPHNDLSLPVVEEAVHDLDAIGLLEDPYRKNLLLLERAKASRPRLMDFFHNMLNWQVGIWDPDPFLNRTVDRVRWLFHPALALAVTAGLLWSLWLVFVNRHRVSFDPTHLLGIGDGGSALGGILMLLLILTVVGAVHEFGHAYACKHFGGPVHRMGFMLMYFGPCFFVDVSHSMLFENRWHRIWVAMGGIYFESFITIIAAVLWAVTPPELYLNDLSYRVMMMGLVMGVLLNLNPLLKFDGYYVLSDLLQISQLREQALPYVRNVVKGWFRRDAAPTERVVGIRRRRAYLIYGLLTFAYSYVVIVCFFEWLRVTLVGAWAETGFFLTACMVALFVRKPVTNGVMKAAEAARRPTPRFLPWAIGIAAILVLALFVRTPAHVSAEARYTSSEREAIRAEEPGRVAAVLVREGDRVFPLQAVAVLENDSVVAAWQGALVRSRESAMALGQAMDRSDPALYRTADAQGRAALAVEGRLSEARSRLVLAARAGGIVVTARTEELLGERLDPGDTLLVLSNEERYEVECDVRETDVGWVEAGGKVELRMRGNPGRKLEGTVERVYSVPRRGPEGRARFRAVVRLTEPAPDLRLGETGIARIEIGNQNVYERIGNVWARLVRADFWL
ncbi:MAG TPA: HlyD family efflux transporter periplasmic adaptor subunit [Candidatus Eisenbacteria bacterium]|nr:HlyD family efflux transporter periplasmic adaptor subunit [Candidatus Eisenbacteria bacterium]